MAELGGDEADKVEDDEEKVALKGVKMKKSVKRDGTFNPYRSTPTSSTSSSQQPSHLAHPKSAPDQQKKVDKMWDKIMKDAEKEGSSDEGE